ncbi:virulence protein RhuM/Fic/DOC family protein [Fluviicola taffensis]|uniref:Death-on-curing family protein n=1 Tax=Fluviicola taffensis (strain DSM 16823 / NCIMB 13979 / RW262) TaxID=755732 RepID=F2IKJ3_FLUTR|nr:virulence protein RhuM/Fic/DOC family protein [Fluviicola taffensis]AEA45119.1 death-on-curing family protein [Fluviicola taffensis DSM 16823]
MSEIILYQNESNQTQIEVTFDGDTIWLTQNQMVDLFSSSKANISEHISTIFKSGELDGDSTVRKFRTVRKEGSRLVSRELEHYNLDMIISVGYRVNTKRGVLFRQWATQRLKEHLVKGYSINQKRLDELQQTIKLVQKSISQETNLSEAKGLLQIIQQYTQSFILLNQFDSDSLISVNLNEEITYEVNYLEARAAIHELKQILIEKKEATQLFGNEKDQSFKGILGNIIQSFDGQYVYSSIEEQAAHLLYFIIKNHPFSDGNKRIGAFLFIWFLEKNKHRFKQSGELKINDNALVALALLVAQSNPTEKELMVKLIVQLIKNQ